MFVSIDVTVLGLAGSLQWRTFFTIFAPAILRFEFKIQSVKAAEGPDGVEQPATKRVVSDEQRDKLRQLVVLLSSVTTLLFVRVNFVSTVSKIQNLLQNYCICFTELFPDNVV